MGHTTEIRPHAGAHGWTHPTDRLGHGLMLGMTKADQAPTQPATASCPDAPDRRFAVPAASIDRTTTGPLASEPRTSSPAARLDLRTAALYCVLMVLVWLPDWSMAQDLQVPGAHPASLSLGLLLVGAIATVFRKTRPVITLVVTGLAATVAMVLTGEIGAVSLQFEAVFSAVLYGSRGLARFTTGLCVAVTGAMCVAVALVVDAPQLWFAALLQTAVVLILPLLWAWEVRHHRLARAQAELAAQAREQLALRERELADARTALQVQEQGFRIAQDLHDGVAGHLSAVALQTAALRTDGMRHATPDQREQVLDSIRAASVDALAEMRALIDVLRQDDPDQAHRGSTLANLQGRLSASFPNARVSIDDDSRALLDSGCPVAQTIARVAQESVTNVLKHADPGPVELNIQTKDGSTTLNCVSHLVPTPTSTVADAGEHAGLGLRSMRLRTEHSGGSFRAGATERSSWVVTAEWPTSSMQGSGGDRA